MPELSFRARMEVERRLSTLSPPGEVGFHLESVWTPQGHFTLRLSADADANRDLALMAHELTGAATGTPRLVDVILRPASDGPGVTRRFILDRREDVSGVTGTGPVADGVQFPDGHVALRWRGVRASTVYWDTIEDAIAVHGHDGRTQVVWLDE